MFDDGRLRIRIGLSSRRLLAIFTFEEHMVDCPWLLLVKMR